MPVDTMLSSESERTQHQCLNSAWCRASDAQGAFNLWTGKPWQDAVDIYDNLTATLGCTAWADPLQCMLTKDTWCEQNPPL